MVFVYSPPKVITKFQALRQNRMPAAGVEPATEESCRSQCGFAIHCATDAVTDEIWLLGSAAPAFSRNVYFFTSPKLLAKFMRRKSLSSSPLHCFAFQAPGISQNTSKLDIRSLDKFFILPAPLYLDPPLLELKKIRYT
ncbi:hypothetical protein PoB_002581500 [Plakobranchus ocellatus]|uniref:Uncharacterized protein n=1 Tax=Plakobranchus ocellatus TaxID=259542 RepID=A0AAV3ZXE2_9GAST|nr:hypothetical protein PoB_002581500 [Plakobranchus ocellatus]